MIIDISKDNLYCEVHTQDFFLDKTYYIKCVDREIFNHPFISFCAPKGLGLSTFMDMLATFYDFRYPISVFNDTEISRDTELLQKRSEWVSLVYDFSEVNENTKYNDMIMDLCKQTAMSIKAIFPSISKLPQTDLLKQFKIVNNITGKKPVLIFKNIDHVLMYCTKNTSMLTSWCRLCSQIYDLCFRADVIYAVFASAHIPSTISLIRDPDSSNTQSLFFDITASDYEFFDDMYGWSGISLEEVESITNKSLSQLSKDDLYEWCGHYAGGLLRIESVEKSLAENDLFLTMHVKEQIDYVRSVLNRGYGSFLLCGDLGVARLLLNEPVYMNEFDLYDPRRTTRFNKEVYYSSRKFLEYLSGEGIISLVNIPNKPIDLAQLVNKEVSLAIADEINEEDDYLSAICTIVNETADVQKDLECGNGQVLGKLLVDYIKAQRKHKVSSPLMSVWQLVHDLISNLEDYTLTSFQNIFLLKHKDETDRYYVVTVGLNASEHDMMESVTNLRLNDISFIQAIGNYKGKVRAYVYNIVVENQDTDPTVNIHNCFVE